LLRIFVYTDTVNNTRRAANVKISEFKRWLESQGAEFKNGANHWKVYLNGKQTTLPRHPSQELKEGTRQGILKQLGLK